MTKISVIIAVHHSEGIGYINETLNGIDRTIGIPSSEYTITLIGKLPPLFCYTRQHSNLKFIDSTSMVGNRRNEGAEDAIKNHNPSILVFMDSHMRFFDIESASWGQVLSEYIKNHPDQIIGPAISLYNNPSQKGHGYRLQIITYENPVTIKAMWWGNPVNNQPFEVPGLGCGFIGMTPKTFHDSVIGYIPPFGIEDAEFNIRNWTLGRNFISIPQIIVGHYFKPTFTEYTRERSIEWGMGIILLVYLNFDDENFAKKVLEKDVSASQDKKKSWDLATTQYWQDIREKLKKLRTRKAEEYLKIYHD